VILVTGGTGFVGRRLVKLLAASGESVRVLTRNPGRSTFPAGVEAVAGDLADAGSLARAVSGASAVVHLAARLPVPGASGAEIERVNAAGTEAVASAARAAGVSRFVHGSSAGVYGDGTGSAPHRESDPPNPGNAYERSKVAGEVALRAALAGSMVGWTILRPTGIYGPGRPATATQFREVQGRRLWLHGPVPVIVHPTYVDDVVAAVQMVLGKGRDDVAGETFNVGGERPLDYPEWIALIAEHMGRDLRQVRAPRWTAWAARAACAGWRVTGVRVPWRLARLAIPVVNRAVDITKARRVLGFTPVPLERGLDETAAWVRAESAA
jgi:nucleoside-diphosphate-sugar epimerase